jgi:hypothetical protein
MRGMKVMLKLLGLKRGRTSLLTIGPRSVALEARAMSRFRGQ